MSLRSIFSGFTIYYVMVCAFPLHAQLWSADNGDGTYKNPILYADYSDPDVIRVKDDYFMVASSFTCQPGIPVLHSKDLVNWTIINYVYDRLPLQRYEKPQHGQGSWAPSIRFHNNKYYVYFCTPEDGLFVGISNSPWEKWELTRVLAVEKWEDPCPFWDDDGQAYLVRGAVGAGPCYIHKMSPDGKKILDNGTMVYQDINRQPVLEGFKFMNKRHGYYYIAAPAGGVQTGWQSVLRSKNIYGPYEDKVVLNQGTTKTNGPHQGGFVDDQSGNWWFMHFQDKDAYGRIVHLQPVTWVDGWPMPGKDFDGDGIYEPLESYSKPNVGKQYPIQIPQTTDEFNSTKIGLQWQWHSAPGKSWYGFSNQQLRLFTIGAPSDGGSLFFTGNLLLQKVMSPEFTATTRMKVSFKLAGERAGITMMGNTYSTLVMEKRVSGNFIVAYEARRENRRYLEPVKVFEQEFKGDEIYLQVKLKSDQTCTYAFGNDGKNFTSIPATFKVEKGIWIGAKVGIYALSANINAVETNYAEFDWFRVE